LLIVYFKRINHIYTQVKAYNYINNKIQILSWRWPAPGNGARL